LTFGSGSASGFSNMLGDTYSKPGSNTFSNFSILKRDAPEKESEKASSAATGDSKPMKKSKKNTLPDDDE